MINYVLYDNKGMIVSYGQAPTLTMAMAQVRLGLTFAEMEYPGEEYYIHNGEVMPRPTLEGFDKTSIAPDGIDTATMIVPPGCVANVNGEDYVIDDGTLEIVAAYPGLYVVKINHWPFMSFEETVTCA